MSHVPNPWAVSSKSFAAPRWRTDVARVVATGFGAGIGLVVFGTNHGAALVAVISTVGAVLGLLLALGGEWISRLRTEVLALQGIERHAEAERVQAGAIKRQLEWQLQVSQREKLISEVHMKVYAGAYREGGIARVPFDALLARIEVESIAAGLNVPLERPEM
jgi:hypothetical protein